MTIREKVARALSDATRIGRPEPGELYNFLVTAAITAFLEAAAEEGWHMRPDEATEEMAVAGCRHENFGDIAGRYRAMLAAPSAEFEWDK